MLPLPSQWHTETNGIEIKAAVKLAAFSASVQSILDPKERSGQVVTVPLAVAPPALLKLLNDQRDALKLVEVGDGVSQMYLKNVVPLLQIPQREGYGNR
jgi:hypothetical protein